jgi:hypothetical protein
MLYLRLVRHVICATPTPPSRPVSLFARKDKRHLAMSLPVDLRTRPTAANGVYSLAGYTQAMDSTSEKSKGYQESLSRAACRGSAALCGWIGRLCCQLWQWRGLQDGMTREDRQAADALLQKLLALLLISLYISVCNRSMVMLAVIFSL